MNQPFYVAPEQLMKDRADYARKGIARGRALVAVQYDDGIVVVIATVDARTGKPVGRPALVTRGFLNGDEDNKNGNNKNNDKGTMTVT